MKYCSKCGKEITEGTAYCLGCGCAIEAPVAEAAPAYDPLKTLIKIFMLIGVIATSVSTYAIGLAWCLPMWRAYNRMKDNGEPISTKFKVCTLIFVSVPAGIMMLCDN